MLQKEVLTETLILTLAGWGRNGRKQTYLLCMTKVQHTLASKHTCVMSRTKATVFVSLKFKASFQQCNGHWVQQCHAWWRERHGACTDVIEYIRNVLTQVVVTDACYFLHYSQLSRLGSYTVQELQARRSFFRNICPRSGRNNLNRTQIMKLE
jgi:hypothetical protein